MAGPGEVEVLRQARTSWLLEPEGGGGLLEGSRRSLSMLVVFAAVDGREQVGWLLTGLPLEDVPLEDVPLVDGLAGARSLRSCGRCWAAVEGQWAPVVVD